MFPPINSIVLSMTADYIMILLCIFLCSLLFIIVMIISLQVNINAWRWKSAKEMKDVPDGSLGWPIVGETLQFLEPHSATSRGSFMDTHCRRYGNVFKSYLFGQPSIISADPDLNRFILQNEEKLFECSYPTSINAILGNSSMLVLVGEAHKRMRGIALSFMNSTKLKALFLDDVERNVVLSLKAWQDGAILSAQEEARKFTFNLIAKQIMSFNPGEDQTIALMKDYYTFMKGVVAVPINFPGTAYNKALESRKRILRRLEKEMMRRKQGHVEEGVDLLSMVTREGILTREEILDLLLSMLFAGHETSSVALTLALKFLAESPAAMDDLRAEHVAIRSSKKPNEKLTWEDYKKMGFTQCVINETLRLGNVVQFVHRKALQDVRFKNYMIPKGWKVLPIFSAVHLDPRIYTRPLAFHPWRWLTMTHNLYFTPFGGGPRLCAGADLAKLEIAIFLHYLSLNFKWQLAEEDRALASPFVQFEKGLPIQVYRFTCNSMHHS